MNGSSVHAAPAGPASRRWLVALVALLLLMGYAFQGTRSLWSTDEGRYSANAVQMIDSGNYLIPAFSPDRPNYTKPPMTAWVIAGSMRLFGQNAWAARAPYALAYVLTALLLYAMALRLVPERPWLPPLVYAGSLFPFMAANIVSTDVLLTLCEAVAMLGFVRAHFGPQDARRRYDLWLMWAGFGLAFLSKGPPGLIALLGAIPFVLRRDGWRGLRRLFAPVGLLLFALIGLGWYLAAVLSTPGLLHYFLHFEVYDRLFTAAQGRHAQWYGWIVVFVPVFTVGTLPWWPAMGRGVRRAVSAASWRGWWNAASPQLFLALWFAIPLLVFCMARSRLPLYALPLFLPLSLMLALDLHERIDLTRTRQRLALAAWIVLLVAIKAVAGYAVHPKTDNRVRARELAAITGKADYNALVFILDRRSEVAVEQHTPWGLRIYAHRTVYGIAWRGAGAADRLCHALDRHHRVLYLVESGVPTAAVATAVQQCAGGAYTTIPLGEWRQRTLLLASP